MLDYNDIIASALCERKKEERVWQKQGRNKEEWV